MACLPTDQSFLSPWKNDSHHGIVDRSISVRQFSERITAWPQDDWSGISDPKRRRKLQNRLNQRARRLRSRIANKNTSGEENIDVASSAVVEDVVPIVPTISEHNRQIYNMQPPIDGSTAVSLAEVESIHILDPDFFKIRRILQQLEAIARAQYMLGSPRTDMLLHLIQFNFIKALRQNMGVLGLTAEQLHDDAISPFNLTGPWQCNIEVSLPSSLRPTIIQRTVPHHPWLDLLPIPELRDNLISLGESYDETRLCLDMKGYGSAYADYTGIIVWRDPWDVTGWEVTESFASSWGWVLRDCWGLFKSTNSWRARRNERPLFRIP